MSCYITTHKNHQVVEIEDVSDSIQEEIQQLYDRLKRITEQVIVSKQSVDNKRKQLAEKYDEAAKNAEEYFDMMFKLLTVRKQFVLSDLKFQRGVKGQSLESHAYAVEEFCKNSEALLKYESAVNRACANKSSLLNFRRDLKCHVERLSQLAAESSNEELSVHFLSDHTKDSQYINGLGEVYYGSIFLPQTLISGNGVTKAILCGQNCFTVEFRDINGRPVQASLFDRLNVDIDGCNGLDDVIIAVDSSDSCGTFEVSYVLQQNMMDMKCLHLNVKLGDKHLPGSPFHLPVHKLDEFDTNKRRKTSIAFMRDHESW